jgi:hypothetical protein
MSESSWTNIMYSGMDQLLIYISLGLLGTKPITCLAFASVRNLDIDRKGVV